MSVIERFYTAFAQRDWSTMGACYHADARFSDPVFPDLKAEEVRAMWKMLLASGSDLRVTFRVLEENNANGVCEWEAFYHFSKRLRSGSSGTGRAVHNIIRSEFELRDGLIFRQRDHFDFWRWSRQALGVSGVLLGWSPLVRNKVRGIAKTSLKRAMGAK